MTDSPPERLPRSVSSFTVALGALALVAVVAGRSTGADTALGWALVYIPLIVMAEYLVIRVRLQSRRDVNALNLVDAILAPLILAFSTPVVVAVVVAAQTFAAVRRNDLVRGSFNVAQWALAAAAGSLTFAALSDSRQFDMQNAMALLAAVAVVGLVNQTAFGVVVTLAQREPLRRVRAAIGPAAWSSWFFGWAVNTSFGLLFASALAAGPAAPVLFVVPMLALHTAYREHTQAAAGRSRLERMHAASRALSAPFDPESAIPAFLAAVAKCYRSDRVDLVLVEDQETVLHRRHLDATTTARSLAEEPLVAALFAGARTTRLVKGSVGPLEGLRAAAGRTEVLASPLSQGDGMIGLLVVYDPSGTEGDPRDELAILDSLTREAAATIEKGRAVQSTLQERALLASLVANASDGILTIAADGTIRSWNPGLARITGWTDVDMLGERGLARLQPRDEHGRQVELERWATTDQQPASLEVTSRQGNRVSLECSYGHIPAREAGDDTLVIVARDVTGAREVVRLQREVGRLTELEAAQRRFVNQLQDAVRPERPEVPGVQMAVEYLPSDPSAPSGGDLYDWQLLPDGDLHLAVVDVLGHGIGATKSAVTVTHVLRILALEGCPLDQLMRRAESLLSAHGGGLVATALVARYRPTTGELRLAGAGHPPALVVRHGGEVEQVSAPGIPFGWPGAGSEMIVELTLEEHDILVLYTDGLIEATRDIIAGLNALEAAAAEMRTLPVSLLVRELVARSLAEGVRRDDSLAMVLRRASTQSTGQQFLHVLPPDPAELRTLRRALSAWLAEAGCSRDSIDALGARGVRVGDQRRDRRRAQHDGARPRPGRFRDRRGRGRRSRLRDTRHARRTARRPRRTRPRPVHQPRRRRRPRRAVRCKRHRRDGPPQVPAHGGPRRVLDLSRPAASPRQLSNPPGAFNAVESASGQRHDSDGTRLRRKRT